MPTWDLSMASSQYSAASEDFLAEIIRQAEDRLSAQLTAAVAADQRAMTFAGLAMAAAGALIGAALGAANNSSLAAPIFVTAAGLLISAFFAVLSARPVPWDYVGNSPSSRLNDIADGTTLHESLAQMAQFYDEMISENEIAISGAADWIRLSMGVALISLVIGLIAVAARLL
jgi:hypothetical protein